MRTSRATAESIHRRRSRRGGLIATAVTLAAAVVAQPALPAHAAVFTVTTTADGGAGSLRAAFETADDNGVSDTINLQAGATYTICQALVHGDTGRALTVNGNGATVVRVCPGSGGFTNNTGAIRNWNKSTLVLRDLTVTGGNGGSTGAIASISAMAGVTGDNELHLDGVHVVDNVGTGSGGGIYADGHVSVIDSVISGNTSGATGGGIMVQLPAPSSGEALSVERSRITDNEAGMGGGIAVLSPAPVAIISSDISGNRAIGSGGFGGTGNGGGVQAAGDVTVLWSTVSNNRSAAPGGGLYVFGDLTLLSSTVSGNRKVAGAAHEAYGVIVDGDLNAAFSTIIENPGVNVRVDGGRDLTAFATVIGRSTTNCWFSGTPGTVTTNGYNVEDADTCGFGTGAGDRTGVADVGLLPLADNGGSGPTHHPTWRGGLLDVVPGANATCNSILFGYDQRSLDRPIGSGCDVGAVEYSPGLLPPHPYTDVPAWVEDAVRWLNFTEVATGYADLTFRPDLNISRAQVVRMLYRLAGSPNVSALPPHGLTDVPAWVQDAVRWAVNDPAGALEPIMTGYADLTFRPDLDISRAQVVRSLHRQAGSPDVSALPPHGLTDVPAWVQDAVRWAVNDPAGALEPIMTGYADLTFRPDLAITRGQVGRALFRWSQR